MNIKSSKGATSVPMMIGVIVCAILVIFLAFKIYDYVLELKVSEEFSCQGTYNILEAVKSSPAQEMKFEYNSLSSQINKQCFTEKLYIDEDKIEKSIYENPSDPLIVTLVYLKDEDAYSIEIKDGVL